MNDYLLVIFLILISTKLCGVLSERVHMPQVVGALIAGIIVGPSFLHIVNKSDFVETSASIGVIILMFMAGLDTDIEELKKTGKTSFFIALFGILVTLVGGFLVYSLFFPTNTPDQILQAFFVANVLTATSVSITIETLREMGKMKGKVATAILGAAIIDDIIGILSLTFIMSFKDPKVHINTIIVKIILYFIMLLIIYMVVKNLTHIIDHYNNMRRAAVYGFCFCLILSYISEYFFQISDITGAYFAGLIISITGVRGYIAKKLNITSYMFFSPIFFASVGIKTNILSVDVNMFIFALILLVVVMLTKVIGCGIGAKIGGFNTSDSFKISCGMISRGEVSIIMAQKGSLIGLLSHSLLPAILIVVVFTMLLTPIILRFVMKDNVELKV